MSEAGRTRGVFITFEGGEGCGKSTQMARVVARLLASGADVVATREPGGTPVGNRIREVLLDHSDTVTSPYAELFLYEASRHELVEQVIQPAMSRGAIVLCDRFADSSTAYQGYGRGIAVDEVKAQNAAATGGLMPDRTILLDVAPAIGLARATGAAAADRLEAEDLAFHERVREGFLTLATEERVRFRVIDANRDLELVALEVAEALADLLP